ncbi:beta-hydroxyacyl-acp dehydratase precursor [Nannochloropsis oceanica]
MRVLAALVALPALCSAFVMPSMSTSKSAVRMMAEGEAAGSEWRGGQAASAVSKDFKTLLTNENIAAILPHRYPFLLVDKVIEFEPGKKAVGIKQITANEPQFTGHFPDRPIMPGVLMVEAMAQLSGVLCLQAPVSDGKGLFFFAGIDGVKFRKPVVPGDTLVMEVELVKFMASFGIAKLKGKAYVDGDVAVEVKEMTFALSK